jgi:hypothetical protein
MLVQCTEAAATCSVNAARVQCVWVQDMVTTIEDNHDGSFEVFFTPQLAGQYTTLITHCGTPVVPDDNERITVQPGEWDAAPAATDRGRHVCCTTSSMQSAEGPDCGYCLLHPASHPFDLAFQGM